MGSSQADEFASLVADGVLERRQALEWHLGSNHYPPVLFMLKAAEDAIDAFNADDFDTLIDLPKGVNYRGRKDGKAPASAIVESFHLDSFVEEGSKFGE